MKSDLIIIIYGAEYNFIIWYNYKMNITLYSIVLEVSVEEVYQVFD